MIAPLRLLAPLLAATFLSIHAGAATETTPIDFSSAGYLNNTAPIPAVPARLEVSPPNDNTDATPLLQSALDALATLPVAPDGFRGALILRPGTYHLSGQLRIRTSGTVLRGHDATLIATGQDRRTLIDIRGRNDRQLGPALAIADQSVPAGATSLTLASTEGLATGTRILIRRPSTKEWIAEIGMDKFTGSFKDQRLDWQPGTRDLEWERTITALDPTTHTITLDAPITTTLEQRHGGGTIHTVTWPGRLTHIGLEGLTCISAYDLQNPRDEEHAWIALSLEHVTNAWIRDVTTRHFVSAAVWLGSGTRAITVQDCHSEAPIGENAGWRRFAFYLGGQQSLVQRCTADHAREAFLAGLCSTGPNLFLDCTATHALADSGSIESLASGTRFARVTIEGATINLAPIGPRYQGAGIVADHCSITSDFQPSTFNAKPSPLPSDSDPITNYKLPVTPASIPTPPLPLQSAHSTLAGHLGFATSSSNAWWKGQTVPARAEKLGWHFARWAPGRIGPGLTEDLADLATRLAAADQFLAHVWPGLWYDRRRDSHQTDAQSTPETWAPFYEQPWARSGQGTATDGLSKYDLTKFNPWYWNRLREFSRACASRGIVVYHHFYNHHNFVEAAAHWADFPWRPVNCLQATGFPEPAPYTNDGRRIGLVAEFYDVSHPVRRELHRAFIWHGLDVLADEPNVIHTLAFQFAGPLTFQKFFLDTVADWEKNRGRKARLALNTSKSITDAILADPVRSPQISVIDQRYWQYLPDGSLFAPHTDGTKAFRENRAETFGKDAVPTTTPALVYQQIREYRDRFPDKLIIVSHAGAGPVPILMAGGAYPLLNDSAAAQPLKLDRDDRALFAFIREHLATTLPSMTPRDDVAENTWCLATADNHTLLLCSLAGDTITLKKPLPPSSSSAPSAANALWFNPATGATQPANLAPASSTIAKPSATPWLLLIRSK